MERRAKSKGGFPMFKKTCWLVLIVTLLGMTLFGTWGGSTGGQDLLFGLAVGPGPCVGAKRNNA